MGLKFSTWYQSPFLFITVMEGLNVVMQEACEKGLFKGFKVPREDLTISHLFYADDALFVGEWCESNIKNLSRILRCFHVVSGLKVNFSKSRVFGIGVETAEVKSLATPLGCKAATLPFTYLGSRSGPIWIWKNIGSPLLTNFAQKCLIGKLKPYRWEED